MTDILSLASRKRVYDHVEANSGSHLREIGRRCQMPLGTALYHLDRLAGEGLVVVRRDGRYKRYFPSHGLGRRDKDYLCALRHDVPRRIVGALLAREALTQRDLCEAIGVSRSTLSFHVNALIGRGILRRELARPEGRYHLEDATFADAILARFPVEPAPMAPACAAPLPAAGSA